MKTDGEKKEGKSNNLRRDRKLIKEVLAGNTDAFGTLMSFYMGRVKALGFSFFKNETDTDDFVQEVFIKVFKNLKSFRGESSLPTWITRIAYTTAVNMKKKSGETSPLEDDAEIPSTAYEPEDTQLRKTTRQAVKEAVKELPDKYAICLEMYFFMDFSHEEIAVITGFPVNTIKSHIFRAKKILREKLKDFYEN